MFFLNDIITYVRRLIKSPSNATITDALIIDYINRFYINDVDARLQLFDLKVKYSFITQPGVDRYNIPLYQVQQETANQGPQNIGFYPVYQGMIPPCYVDGVQVALQTQKNSFYSVWPNVAQNFRGIIQGNGGINYTFQLPLLPGQPPPNPPIQAIIRGHVDISGIISQYSNAAAFPNIYSDPPLIAPFISPAPSTFLTKIQVTSVEPAVWITALDASGTNMIVCDSGQFLTTNINSGVLMNPGKAPFGNTELAGGYDVNLNTVNYVTGQVNVTFPNIVPQGNNINVDVLYFQSGLPRSILFYNNTIHLRTIPDKQYFVEMDAYLSPAAFLNSSDAVPFGYMSEYIARGAARKILTDTGDIEQYQFYEPLFREQEILVWKRSQRTWTQTRTETIYSQGFGQGQSAFNNLGGGTI